MITHLATSCLFPAVRLAQFIRPCMSDLYFLCELRIPVSSFPKFLCVSLDTHRPDVLRDATLFVDPGRPSESSPMCFLCFGFWAVEIIAICIWAIFICTCPCHPARMVWCGTGENAVREAVSAACPACPVHLARRSLRDPLCALLSCFYCCLAIFDANNTWG
jgi:hypothetical protein